MSNSLHPNIHHNSWLVSSHWITCIVLTLFSSWLDMQPQLSRVLLARQLQRLATPCKSSLNRCMSMRGWTLFSSKPVENRNRLFSNVHQPRAGGIQSRVGDLTGRNAGWCASIRKPPIRHQERLLHQRSCGHFFSFRVSSSRTVSPGYCYK